MFHGVNMCFKKFYFELCIFKINIKIDCFNYFSQFKKRLNSYIRLKNSIKGGTRDKRKEKKSTGQGLGAMWITEIRELETGKGSSF